MRVIGRLILCATLVVVTGLLIAAASFVPSLFFLFYTDLSKQLLGAVASVTNALPFALWEWLVVLAVLIAVLSLIIWKKPLRWLTGMLVTLCITVLLFLVLWGLNYFAPPVSERMQLQVQEPSAELLQQTAMYMARQAEQAAGQVERDDEGRMLSDLEAWSEQAGAGYDILAQDDPFFEGADAVPKKLLTSSLFSRMGFTGIFVPFTAESCINTETDAVTAPFTMCHELAHRLTVAKEDEANFCAFLACIAHPDPDFRYSGWYNGFVITYNALYEKDRAAALAVSDSLSDTLRRDINAANAYYAQYDTVVQDAAQKANDLYLKTMGDEDGAKSYDKASDLLVAWYKNRS